MQGASASVVISLGYFIRNIPVSAPEQQIYGFILDTSIVVLHNISHYQDKHISDLLQYTTMNSLLVSYRGFIKIPKFYTKSVIFKCNWYPSKHHRHCLCNDIGSIYFLLVFDISYDGNFISANKTHFGPVRNDDKQLHRSRRATGTWPFKAEKNHKFSCTILNGII